MGHFILFVGLPLFCVSSATEIADDLMIRTVFKAETPKKIQMTQSPKKEAGITNSSTNLSESAEASREQGGNASQPGLAFKLPNPGILYYDAYVDGQKYQTAEIDWIVEGNDYRLYVNIPYAFVGPFVFDVLKSSH